MIIVTGEPRSGTSLMMESLRLMGFDVWGEEQPGEEVRANVREKDGIEETLEDRLKREKAQWMNNKFWEISGLVMKGVNPQTVINHALRSMDEETREIAKKERNNKELYTEVVEQHKDHAVKVIWNGLMNTDRPIVETAKIILCLRNPLHIAKSQTHLSGVVETPVRIGEEVAFMSPETDMTPFRYLNSASKFTEWLQKPMNKHLDILRVDYDNMIFNTEKTINRIANFLVKNDRYEFPVDENIQLAVANVDPDLRRSAEPPEPTGDLEEWELVNDLYAYLKDDIYTKELVQARVQEYEEFRKKNPENAQWTCSESFWPMNVALWRDYLTKEKLRTNMLKSTERRRRASMICTDCPLYKESLETYEVVLPDDLDNIVRNKVDCAAMGVVTIEECHNHFKQVRENDDFFKRYGVESKKVKKGRSTRR